MGDHFQFWAAGHLVATGGSMYDRSAWQAIAALGPVPDGVAVNTVIFNLTQAADIWPYPPTIAFLLAPFGALPLAAGVTALHLFVALTAIGSVVLGARIAGLRGLRLGAALSLTVVSEPFIVGVRDGHPIGLLLLGMTLLFVGLRDKRYAMIAAGVAIMTIKPHLAIAGAIATIALLVWRRDRRGFASAALSLIVVTILAELRDPYPLARISGAAGTWLGFDVTTVGALARDLGGGLPLTIALLLLASALATFAVARADRPVRWATAYAAVLAMSLVLAPYAHDYDMLLVLPALVVVAGIARGSLREPVALAVTAILIVVVPWMLFLWWPLLGQTDRPAWGGPLGSLPLIAVGALAVAIATRAAAPSARRTGSSP